MPIYLLSANKPHIVCFLGSNLNKIPYSFHKSLIIKHKITSFFMSTHPDKYERYRIEQNIENKSCLCIWVDPKNFLVYAPTQKMAQLGPKCVKFLCLFIKGLWLVEIFAKLSPAPVGWSGFNFSFSNQTDWLTDHPDITFQA